jgi:predicted AlkP superfamily phosphohydrolase/phosphomutase
MPKPRVLVIGLDGATWDLLRPWAAEGHLPHLARLLEEGSSGRLMSTIPPVSPAAWSSFMTGKNPGKHGVFDFTVRDFDSYRMRVASRPSEPTLWGLLSARGRRVCVINVPQTFPPEPVNGYMVTGLGTPSQTIFTHPEELTQDLRRAGYRIVPAALLHRDGAVPFVEEVYQIAEETAHTALRLMAQQDWDLSVVVLRLTDEIPHYFWHWMDRSHPAHQPSDPFHSQAVFRAYQKADELVGQLIAEAVDSETTVLVMSDHGFGPLHKDVYLNEWLRQAGFLTLRSSPTLRALVARFLRRLGLTRSQVGHTLSRWGLQRLRGALRDGLGMWAEVFPNDEQPRVTELVDWDRTRAYSVGYIGQIYANLAGRDPQGVVSPGEELEEVLADLTRKLRTLVDPADGKPIVDQVFHKAEVYTGPHLSRAPDLLLLMRGLAYITRQGYEFDRAGHVFGTPPTQETGGHRMEGILIASGHHIARNKWLERARIEDLAPTILHLLACEVPTDMDGEVLQSLLQPDFVAGQPIRYIDVQWEQDAPADLTPEEEQSLLEHLRNLGYIG